MQLSQRRIEHVDGIVCASEHDDMPCDVLGIVLDGVMWNDAEDGRLEVDGFLANGLIVEGLAVNHFHHACDDGRICFASHLETEGDVARHASVHVDKAFGDAQVFGEEGVRLPCELLPLGVGVCHLEGEDGIRDGGCHAVQVRVADGLFGVLEDDIDIDGGRPKGIDLLESCGDGVAIVQLGDVHDDDGVAGISGGCQHHVVEDVRRGEAFHALCHGIEHIEMKRDIAQHADEQEGNGRDGHLPRSEDGFQYLV